MRINPFKPNSPVSHGMFAGRLDEIRRLEESLVQARLGEPAHFMITGERGIGKTSLLLYLRSLALGLIPYSNTKFRFLSIDLDVDSNSTQLGLIRRIQIHLDHELGKSERARNFLKDAWSFLQRIRIMDSGFETDIKDASDEVLLDEFAISLAELCSRTCNPDAESIFSAQYDGILLLIDEADNCPPHLRLGSFLKLLLERLQRRNCNRVLVGLAGLPDLRRKLHDSHPSALRIFEEIQIDRLSNQEVSQVITMCLKKAEDENKAKTEITEKARQILIGFSEGYPHFIQQFGFSTFSEDIDNVIDDHDVINGAFGPRKALDLIGDRYYRNDFYNKIQQDSYRQVLRIMADDLDGWVARPKIAAKFKGKSSILNNALKALRDRHIILSKEGLKGVYRLQDKGFALWIKLYADPEFLHNFLSDSEKAEKQRPEQSADKSESSD